ncbi:hypothetical protein DKX38_028720 [Salix brachista]|uniref:Protein kinase domain-containing protein n=1 Tax=Salix brachista TaxID=2182728 RepID=A0A5N5J9Z1_9ROSI|nr:hypothetical protein DKX38_028720 [Salix brachista]
MWVFLPMMVLSLWPVAASTARSVAKPGCQEKCGNVSVPYPFGILEPSCAMNDNFFLNCTSNDEGHPELYVADMTTDASSQSISNIELEGTVTLRIYPAFRCYNKTGIQTDSFKQSINLGSGPFTLSNTRNIFTATGCNTSARVTSNEFTYGAGCLSFCTEYVEMSDENPCSGSGCCQTSIPKGLKSLCYVVTSAYYNSSVSDFNPCGFAFLADKRSLKISDWPLSRTPKYGTDVVIEWVVENKTCEQAKANTSAYACGANAYCTYAESGQGYLCSCNKGFEGNPYLKEGCQGVGVGFGAVLFLFTGLWWLYKVFKRKRCQKLKKKYFNLLVQEQLSSGEVNVEKLKIFPSKELDKATDHYNANRMLGQGGQGTVYKGMLADGKIIAVKKSKVIDEGNLKQFINEVILLSQINHRNVVKLLGCCLETELPLLVYEFIPNGTLFQFLHDPNEEFPLTWEMRLRIAAEVAGALFYLHSAASIAIFHRDIKCTNILLDEKYRAKVADFGISRSKAISFTRSEEQGRSLATYFLMTMESNCLFDILDPQVVKQGKKEDVLMVASLARSCLRLNGKERPTMKEVTMVFERIQKSENLIVQREIEYDRKEVMGAPWDATSTSTISSFGISASSSLDEKPLLHTY